MAGLCSSSGLIQIPAQLKDVLESQRLSSSLIEQMSVEDWVEFERRCGGDIPFGLLLQVRFAIADRIVKAKEELAREELELASVEVRRDKAFSKKAKRTVGKLFHGDEGIGTLIYVAKAVGLCAFHSIHVQENHTILEDSLSVDGFAVKFMAGYPALDIALYRIVDVEGQDREGPFIDLELDSYMFEGSPIQLLSFPAFDSQSRDVEGEEPMFIDGTVSRLQLEKHSALAVGHYSSFPNSSGGAVISKRGKLLGVHVEGIYHEDHGHYRPPCSAPLPEGPIYPPLPTDGEPVPALLAASIFEGKEPDSSDDKEEKKTDLLQFAVSNVKHKDSLAAFIPIYHLREVLKKEKVILPKKCRQGKKARI